MPHGKRYSTCSRTVVQGQLDYRTQPAGRCCTHGYFGKNVEVKERLVNSLEAMSEHFKVNKEFLVPSSSLSLPPTKPGLKYWGLKLRRNEPLLHDVLACSMTSRDNEWSPQPEGNFFEEMIGFVRCPICFELTKMGLPTNSNPRQLLGPFHERNKESINAEAEMLDEAVDKWAETKVHPNPEYERLSQMKEKDSAVCIKKVRREGKKRSRANLRHFLQTAYEGRPDLRTKPDLALFGLCESSSSDGSESSISESGCHSLVPRRHRIRTRDRRVLLSEWVVGFKVSHSKKVLSLGPGSKSDRIEREVDRAILLRGFISFKSRWKKINSVMWSFVVSRYELDDFVTQKERVAKLKKIHTNCDWALSMSGKAFRLQLQTGTDEETDPPTADSS